jgi:hypothetical protein
MPYSVSDGNGDVESGVIDALFQAKDAGRWWSSRSIASRVTIIWKKYWQRRITARYLTAAEQLLGERPQPVLCFLNAKGSTRQVESSWDNQKKQR